MTPQNLCTKNQEDLILCSECRWWDDDPDQHEFFLKRGEGLCRRNSPQGRTGNDQQYRSAWPITSSYDYCGSAEPDACENT